MAQIFSDRYRAFIINNFELEELLRTIPKVQYNEVEKILMGKERKNMAQLYRTFKPHFNRKNTNNAQKQISVFQKAFREEIEKDFSAVGLEKVFNIDKATYNIEPFIDDMEIALNSYTIDMYNNISNIAEEIKRNLSELEAGIDVNVSNDFKAYEKRKQEIKNKIYNERLVTADLKVIDSLGRGYKLDYWIERRLSTDILNTMQNELFQAMEEFDHDLVIINYNVVCSPLCINRQNKIYWYNKPNLKYPELAPELWTNGGGLFHPHCRHYINAYFEGFSDKPVIPKLSEKERNKLYEKDQARKYATRNKKKYYERMQKAKAMDLGDSYAQNRILYKKWLERSKI